MFRRHIGGIAIAVGVVVVLVAGAVWAVDWFQGRLPGKPYELEQACAGTSYERAAPYAGSGPHPIAIFMPNEAGSLRYTQIYSADERSWPPSDPDDTDDVQLVACGTLTNEEPYGGPDCGYELAKGGISLPRVRATYQVRIYELSTHREVDSLLVEGEKADCPFVINGTHPPDRLLSELTFAQWQQAIGDLVTKNR